MSDETSNNRISIARSILWNITNTYLKGEKIDLFSEIPERYCHEVVSIIQSNSKKIALAENGIQFELAECIYKKITNKLISKKQGQVHEIAVLAHGEKLLRMFTCLAGTDKHLNKTQAITLEIFTG